MAGKEKVGCGLSTPVVVMGPRRKARERYNICKRIELRQTEL
jgi:hypothetical protein